MYKTDIIKTIFLDLGNVVVRYDPTAAIGRFAPYTALPAGEIFQSIARDGLIERYEEGRITSEEFFAGVCKVTGCSLTFDRFQTIWEDMFSINPFMEGVIKKLKGSYSLILLSNTNEMHFRYIQDRFPIIRQLDEVVVSFRVGFMKPKKEIYRAALDTARTEPGRCLFIDDLESNISGAREAGIRTILYTDDEAVARGLAAWGIEIA